jgi:N-carbamoyl-L-amino-acid hydrolase
MTTPASNLRINGERLWDSLMEMAKIGPGLRGGNNRQTLTDEDAEGRRLFQSWCEAAGMSVQVDGMGTMFARRAGADDSLPPVLVGSHLDTQPTGGKFDGVLGVLGGLEVIRTLNDLGIRTKHPIEVVNWTNEEGARFAPAMLASGVYAGVLDQEWAYERTDAKGAKFGAELERIGFKGSVPVGGRKLHAFFELHIEQGPILEDEGIDIGVVTHGQGLKWLQVTLTGKESHTGSTPMPKRRNAGLGMARVTELVHEVAMDYQPEAVGAGRPHGGYPNSRNIIAGRTVFTVDIRSPDKATLDEMDERFARHRHDLRSLGYLVRDRAGRPFRPGRLRRVLRQGGPRRAAAPRLHAPQTSSRAPATTPAGSTASPPPQWCSAPASTASATMRTRTFRRNGPSGGQRAVSCCGGDGGDCGLSDAALLTPIRHDHGLTMASFRHAVRI